MSILDLPGAVMPYNGWLRAKGSDARCQVFHYFPGNNADKAARCGACLIAPATCRVGEGSTICPACRAKAPPLRASNRRVLVSIDHDLILGVDRAYGRGRRGKFIEQAIALALLADRAILAQVKGAPRP